MSINIDKISQALNSTSKAKIIVFGDYALDKYFYTDPENDELSVETGIPAYQIHRKYLSAGVGGTITQNLRSLGANVMCIGIIGDDGEGYELLKILNSIGADTTYMVKTDELATCTYFKPMRKTASGKYIELNRMDVRNLFEPPLHIQKQLLKNLDTAVSNADAVIITDQFFQRNQGAVTDYIRDSLSDIAKKYSDKIFFADSRQYINEYDNMILKCNNLELFQKFAGGEGDPENLDEIIKEGSKIQSKTKKLFFVTRGEKGIVVFDGKNADSVTAFKVTGPIDIVGAGDATNASLVLGLVLGLTPTEAAKLACAVSSITIQQIGTTGVATKEQVNSVLSTLK